MLQSGSPGATFKSKALVKLQFIQLCYRLSPHRLPGGARGKEPTRQYRRLQKGGFDPWVRKILWRRAQQPTPVFLPSGFHGQRVQSILLQTAGPDSLQRVGHSRWDLVHTSTTINNCKTFTGFCFQNCHNSRIQKHCNKLMTKL